jgi:hypothetical protein
LTPYMRLAVASGVIQAEKVENAHDGIAAPSR